MATVAETQALFRSYIDEPDSTFITDADISTYLQRGYDEFRHLVIQIDPSTYQLPIFWGVSNALFYDLSAPTSTVRLLGSTPQIGGVTAPRLVQIVDIQLDTSSTLGTTTATMPSNFTTYHPVTLNPAPNSEALYFQSGAYTLQGTTLLFSESITGTLGMKYVPESSVVWTVGGAGVYIDDLTLFHDLIALLAYKQYAIRDGAINEPLERQLAVRSVGLKEYLQSRVQGGAQYVQPHLL